MEVTLREANSSAHGGQAACTAAALAVEHAVEALTTARHAACCRKGDPAAQVEVYVMPSSEISTARQPGFHCASGEANQSIAQEPPARPWNVVGERGIERRGSYSRASR